VVDVAQGGGKHRRSEIDLKGKKELVSKNHGKSFTKKKRGLIFLFSIHRGIFPIHPDFLVVFDDGFGDICTDKKSNLDDFFSKG